MTAVRQARASAERQPRGGRRPLPFWLLLIVALAGGAATSLSFPPLRVPGIAILGVAAGLWSFVRAGGVTRGALCGFAWGVGFGGMLFRWATALDVIAYVALVPVQALYWTLAGGLIAWVARGRTDARWVVGATAIWTATEALRARWPFGGFEWGQLGWAAVDLPIRTAAAVVGGLGLTALGVALAAALVALVASPSGGWRPMAGVAVASAALAGVGAVGWTAPAGALDVGVVQVDDPCPGAFAVDCPDFRAELLDRHVAGTAALGEDLDLLLWGEGTLRAATPEDAGETVLDEMALPAPLLSGVANPAGPGRFHQRNVLYDVNGAVLAVYDKRHPVPFGEYVPFRDLLGGIGDVGRFVPTDLVPGERAVAMPVPRGDETVDLGTVVSWEVTFARDVRDAGRRGEAVVTLTTQASYGPGQTVSDQLLEAARLRAAELQQGMVVAATTGRSAIVLPGGEIPVEPTALYAADTLTGELPLREGSTPFAWWGEWPVIALAVGGAVVSIVLARREQSARA